MKKSLLFLSLIWLSLYALAQTPQSFKYQTVARNYAGDVLASQNISFRMTIVQGELPGTVVYSETHAATTNAAGLTTLEIGRGTPVSGSFAAINWSQTPIFLKTETDRAGGTAFVEMGTSELLSVPFALFSANGVQSMTTAERDALENSPVGLQIYNSTSNCLNYFNGTSWFEACGTCTPQPSHADAGDDQNFTDNTLTATLAANTPVQGTGLWTVQTGAGGSFDDVTNPEATFTGEPCTAYTLTWTITNTCGSTADQTDISFFATPTVANAGNDTVVLGGDLSVNLNTSTPLMGNGLWTILSGEGGIFEDATNPTTLFTGLSEVTYTLQWAIATVCDTSYDEVTVAFYTSQCGSQFTDVRDGQTYETVLIGNQCWMAENLNIGTRINGSSNQTNNITIEKYCYDNSDAQCNAYGGLYQWDEMMGYTSTPGVKGICPEGWHVPTDAQLTALTTYVSSQPEYLCNSNTSYISKAMAATTNWDYSSDTCVVGNNLSANNSTGFTALPGGYRITSGSFGYIGNSGLFWSSTETEFSTTDAYIRYMYSGNWAVTRTFLNKGNGMSVRCLRD